MGPIQKVEIEGLKDFGRELRRTGKELPKELRRENRAIVKPIAKDGQQRYEQTPRSPNRPASGPRTLQSRSGRSQKSIKALASVSAAKVAIGGPSLPHVVGQNFGSFGGPRKAQFPERADGDWFLYAAISKAMPTLRKKYLEAIDRVSQKAFPGRFGRIGGIRGG